MTTPSLEILQGCANALTLSSDDEDIVVIAAQANSLTTNREFYVNSADDLPDLLTSGIQNGQIAFVGSLRVPVVASNYRWIGLDQRPLRRDGFVSVLYTWGSNTSGGLGNGGSINQVSPVTTAGGGTTWCQVSGGSAHTAAVKTDGTLWTWGNNVNGRLGDNSVVNRSSPGTTAGGGTTWCQVSGSFAHAAAVKTDGTLWTWGCNPVGQLGTNSTVDRSSPGTTAGGGTTWCQVSGGFAHTAAVKTDGTLWTWGNNVNGRLGDNSVVNRSSPGTTAGGGTTWCQVSGSFAHTLAVKTDGTLWTWGINQSGALGNGTIVSRSSPGTTAGGGTTWCQVCGSVSSTHTAAIKTDGTLWTWGRNSDGSLGDGLGISRSSPGTTAGGGTTWCHASSGGSHTAAIALC